MWRDSHLVKKDVQSTCAIEKMYARRPQSDPKG
jgi:hypothetical protein